MFLEAARSLVRAGGLAVGGTTTMRTILSLLLLGSLFGSTAFGQTQVLLDAPPVETQDGEEAGAKTSRTARRGPLLAGGYLHSFQTDIDGGGAFSSETGFATGRLGFPVGKGFLLGGQMAWQGDWYSFAGQNGVAPPDEARPWGDVHSIAGSMSLGRRAGKWWWNAAFTARFSFETGASIGDSFNPGGIVGGQYTFSPGLRLGLGVLVNSRLEDDVLIVPIPFVYWEITEQFVLSNSIAPDAYPRGPGLEVAWRPHEEWAVALGGRWEFRRFRLNDDGFLPRHGGVGEDEGIPLWLRVTWRLGDHLRADVLGGYSVSNRLRLADADGAVLRSAGTDPIPYVGAFVTWQF